MGEEIPSLYINPAWQTPDQPPPPNGGGRLVEFNGFAWIFMDLEVWRLVWEDWQDLGRGLTLIFMYLDGFEWISMVFHGFRWHWLWHVGERGKN